MWQKDDSNPSNNPSSRGLKGQVPATKENTIGQSGRLSDEASLRYYIKNSGMVARAYGLKIVGRAGKRKLEVDNLEVIKGLDEGVKHVLRELLKEGEFE